MKTFFFIIFCVFSLISFSQTNFEWEKNQEVVKSKSEFYSDTKSFIAENFNSANDVIQNDDKDNGIIIVKAISVQKPGTFYGDIFKYSYLIKFQMKDSLCRIIITNVQCFEAYHIYDGQLTNVPCIPPYEGDEIPVKVGAVISKKKAKEMMISLKSELQNIFDKYIVYIQEKHTF